MVLTPRLRTFNIADPSPMEVEMGSDSGTNPSSRKRQRSVTYDAPDALPDDLPELPKLSGQIMLEVFTHRSLRLACHAKYRDNERLSVLGSYILEMMTTQLLFNKKPMLTRSEIEVSAATTKSQCHETMFRKVERQRLLSVDIIDAWADFYRLRDELRYDPSFQSSLGEVEVGGASVRFGEICSTETGV
jgi:hypothetical protein